MIKIVPNIGFYGFHFPPFYSLKIKPIIKAFKKKASTFSYGFLGIFYLFLVFFYVQWLKNLFCVYVIYLSKNSKNFVSIFYYFYWIFLFRRLLCHQGLLQTFPRWLNQIHWRSFTIIIIILRLISNSYRFLTTYLIFKFKEDFLCICHFVSIQIGWIIFYILLANFLLAFKFLSKISFIGKWIL